MDKKVKVKTTTRYNYVYDQEQENWVVSDHFVTEIQTRDEAGHLISEQSFNRDGESGEHNEYLYDDQGRVVEERIYFEDEELAERHTFEYREDGKMSVEHITYQDSYSDQILYTYDSYGNLTERRQMDDEGEVESCETYVYEGELLIKETVIGSEGEFISEAVHAYDDRKNLVETVMRGREEHESIRMVYEYDEKGNRDCVERYNKDGQIVARTTNTFDEKGNIIEIFEEDTITSKTIKFQVDDKGHAVLQEEFNEKEELSHRIERVYDPDGELIESIVYVDRHDQGPDQYYSIKQEFEYF